MSSEDNLWKNPEPLEMDLLIKEETLHLLQDDPDRVLRNNHPRGYPQANMQELLLRRLDLSYQFTIVDEPILFFQGDPNDPPQSWKKIATELNIPIGTVTSHFSNNHQQICRYLADQ